MHLIFGHSSDPFCSEVLTTLTARGQRARIVDESNAEAFHFDFRLVTGEISGSAGIAISQGNMADGDVESVFFRASNAVNPAGWSPRDLAYVQAETQAALLAWLTALDCPVVNRLGADLWYRPRSPLLQWLPLLSRAGLSVPAITVTSDPLAARRFRQQLAADGVPGAVCSSLVRSTSWLVGPADWAGVEALQAYAPMCLIEPHGTPRSICIAGHKVICDQSDVRLDAALEESLCHFAELAGLDLVEVTLGRVRRGWAVIDVDLLPQLGHFERRTQAEIVDAVTDILQGITSTATDLLEVSQ